MQRKVPSLKYDGTVEVMQYTRKILKNPTSSSNTKVSLTEKLNIQLPGHSTLQRNERKIMDSNSAGWILAALAIYSGNTKGCIANDRCLWQS
ncbi:MAG: hypothetical protein V8S84_03005 [Lachnospiraceae bacterium]